MDNSLWKMMLLDLFLSGQLSFPPMHGTQLHFSKRKRNRSVPCHGGKGKTNVILSHQQACDSKIFSHAGCWWLMRMTYAWRLSQPLLFFQEEGRELITAGKERLTAAEIFLDIKSISAWRLTFPNNRITLMIKKHFDHEGVTRLFLFPGTIEKEIKIFFYFIFNHVPGTTVYLLLPSSFQKGREERSTRLEETLDGWFLVAHN